MTKPQSQTALQEPSEATERCLETFRSHLNALQSYDAPLNQNELKSVKAVIAYVAYTQNVSKETVSSVLTTAFGVESVTEISQGHYDDVIRYLVDLRMDEILN